VTLARVRVSATIISSVAGILAGILGSWLTGKWLWGVAVGVLLLIAVVAGAEAVKVQAEGGEGSRKKSGEDALVHQEVSIKVGRDFTPIDSIVAGRDLIQNQTTNANSRKGSLVALAAICLCSLLVGTGGTIYLRPEPRGHRIQVTHAISRPTVSHTTVSPESSATPFAGNASQWKGLHRAATFTETDATGDSITQAIWFSTPIPLSQLPAVASVAQSACSNNQAANPPGRDLVVPFAIASRLNSDVAVQATVTMSVDDFLNSSSQDGGLVQLNQESTALLGDFQGGMECDDNQSFGDGGSVSLSRKGDYSVFGGWIIFSNAITADYPDGDIPALGQTYAQLDIGQGGGTAIDRIQASGPGVCVGESVTNVVGQTENVNVDPPPFLHIGGPVYSWEGCSGHYSGSLDSSS
jgi:hypothetical protein